MYGTRVADMHGLYRMVYASRAKRLDLGSDHRLVDPILRVSHTNNLRAGVTGALLLCGGWFLQTLEGRRVDVSVTYRRIEADPRHDRLRLIDSGAISERGFGQWSMCAALLTPSDQAIVMALNGCTSFNPAVLSADQALGILLEVARLQPAVAA
jgi:hypothetical protein